MIIKLFTKIGLFILLLVLPEIAIAADQQHSVNLGKKTGSLCIIPDKGLCQVMGVTPLLLDNHTKLSRVVLPQSVNSIVYSGTHIYAQSGNSIYSCDSRLKKVFTFEDDNFLMFPCANADGLYIVGFSGFTSTIYRCYPSKHSIEIMNHIDEDIIYLCDKENGIVVVTKEKVYIKEDDKWIKQLSFFENINSATYTSKGLVLATDNYIVLVVDKDRVAVLSDWGCKQLLSNDNVLYVVDHEDNILCFEL